MLWVVGKLSLYSDSIKYVTDVNDTPVTVSKIEFYKFLAENIESVKDYHDLKNVINRFHTVYLDVSSGDWKQVSRSQFETFNMKQITDFIEKQEEKEELQDKETLRKKQANSTRNKLVDKLWQKKKLK